MDIGHAELLAFCMQEECLPGDLPRIVVMDSNSVRKRMIELRDHCDNTTERYKIRKIYGGLGKTLISRASYHINLWRNKNTNLQNNIDNRKTVRNPAQHNENDILFSKLRRRNAAFIKKMDEWTEIDDSLWKPNYKDHDELRTIIEVDSHQLNSDGSDIRSEKRRYPNLTPNIAILNANYWADEGASFAIRKCEDKYNYEIFNIPKDLHIPLNNLRFHILFDGKLIDKNLSDFLSSKLENERILRFQQREFQGFIARLAPSADITPRDLARSSSHRRYLSNLTPTHTRACYKCKQYLALNIMDKEKCPKQLAKTRFYELLLTKNLIKHNKDILECQICKDQHNQKDNSQLYHKRGNRRHFTHFCTNEKIQKFRNDINDWIENNLRKIWNNIGELRGKKEAILFLSNINKLLRSKELQDEGKLEQDMPDLPPGNVNTITAPNYLTMKNWCKLLRIDNIEDGIQKKVNILQCILGFRTALPDGAIEEGNMGATDAIGLGIIPKALQNNIKSFLKATKINDRILANSHTEVNMKIWYRIRDILKGRGIGIHRITSTLTKEREKNLRIKFDIPSKKECKRNFEKLQADLLSKENEELSKLYTKTCKGPTCKIIIKKEDQSQKMKTPNSIRITHRICQRCRIHETAQRRKDIILGKILDMDRPTCYIITNLISSEENINKILYSFMAILLKNFGEMQPWLTEKNCKSHNGRGIKPGAKKPLQFTILALRHSPKSSVPALLCSQCKEDATNKFSNCPKCLLTNSIHQHRQSTRDSKESNLDRTKSESIITPSPKRYKKEHPKFNPETTSPLIISNLNNEFQLCKSPRKLKGKPKNSENMLGTKINDEEKEKKKINSLSYQKENSSIDSRTTNAMDIPKPNSDSPVLSTLKANPPITKVPENYRHDKASFHPEVQNHHGTTDDIPKKQIEQIRLQNNRMRSTILNALLGKISEISTNEIHIANSNFISHVYNNNKSTNIRIPERINFSSKNARRRDIGTYIFPVYTGSFHHGRWITMIVIKRKSPSINHYKGWILDPKNEINVQNQINEMSIIQSTHIFNRSIDWTFPHCKPLYELECGPRVVTACLIISIAEKEAIPWDVTLHEASQVPISTLELSPHFCREVSYKTYSSIKEIWKCDILFSKITLTKTIIPQGSGNKNRKRKNRRVKLINIANKQKKGKKNSEPSTNNNNRKGETNEWTKRIALSTLTLNSTQQAFSKVAKTTHPHTTSPRLLSTQTQHKESQNSFKDKPRTGFTLKSDIAEIQVSNTNRDIQQQKRKKSTTIQPQNVCTTNDIHNTRARPIKKLSKPQGIF